MLPSFFPTIRATNPTHAHARTHALTLSPRCPSGRRVVDATASGPVRSRRTQAIQEHPAWRQLLAMPNSHLDQTAGSICGQLAHAAHAKKRSPIHSLCWSREGRALVTGNRDGEFTLWRGTDFAPPDQSVVTVISAHTIPEPSQINSICLRQNDGSYISGDAVGTIKYW